MRVLVLGGGGYLGLAVSARLLGAGHEVTIFGRSGGSAVSSGAPVIHGDRNRLEESVDAFRRLRPDIVVDLIAFTERQAKALVAVFRGIARRVVVASSGDVYRAYDVLYRRVEGELEPAPLAESARLRDHLFPYRGASPPFSYGFDWNEYDKILVESAVLGDSDLPATVLRLPMMYGPGDRQGFKRRFFPFWKRMDDGRPALLLDRLTARWRAPWGFTEDVAEAIRLAAENDGAAGRIYNCGETGALDLEAMLRELAGAIGWTGTFAVVDQPCPPPNFPRQLNLEQRLDMDTTKIRGELGFTETTARRDALAKTVEWERANFPAHLDGSQFDYAAEDAILKSGMGM